MSEQLKGVIFGFILYVLYDSFLRSRAAKTYVTKEELAAATAAQRMLATSANYDWENLNGRLRAVEKSGFA